MEAHEDVPISTRPKSETAEEGRSDDVPREAAPRLPGLRLALLAGFLLWLACPPVGAWPLAWVALAPLVISVTRAATLRQALWRGYLFGWAYIGPLCYWTGLVIILWTGSRIGWLAWFALTFLMAGFYAAWGGAAWWLARRLSSDGQRILSLAAAWAVMEWARATGALTMPWGQLSYTQYRFLPVLQIADVTGAVGVSFLVALVNGALAFWWLDRTKPHAARWIWTTLTLTAVLCLYGLGRLMRPETGATLPVAVMQGNFSVFEKREDAEKNRRMFRDLTRRAITESGTQPALFVWSESAVTGDALNDIAIRSALQELAREHGAAVVVGSRVTERRSGVERNSSLLFPPDGGPPARYDKRQLVAFGEYIPYRDYWPPFLSQTFQFFSQDATPGSEPTVLRFTPPQKEAVALGPLICYESMYPYCARHTTLAGANLLANQTNDAWFQSRPEMEQHLAALVLRAIENRRDMARATTTGITCVLDAYGRIPARAPLDTPAFVVHSLRLRAGITPYTRLGDWFVASCGLLLIVNLIRRPRSISEE